MAIQDLVKPKDRVRFVEHTLWIGLLVAVVGTAGLFYLAYLPFWTSAAIAFLVAAGLIGATVSTKA